MRAIVGDNLRAFKFHPLPYTHITPPDADAESYKRGWNDAIDAIMADAPTIDLPHWIPVTERLPENETKYYLVTVANHGLFFTTTSTDSVEIVRWDYDRRKGRDSWHWCTERTVTAWMPLPEPYKEAETWNTDY